MRKFLYYSAATTTAIVVNANKLQAPTSAISKVISLLKDMKTQVETETANGAVEADKVENQCIADISGLEGDVQYTTEKLDTASATQENAAAQAARYQAEAEGIVPVIAQAELEIKDSSEAEKEAQIQYASEEAELVETTSMLTSAYAVLKRSLEGPVVAEEEGKGDTVADAFLQMNKKSSKHVNPNEIQKVVTALKSIINSAWAGNNNNQNKKQLKSFLQDMNNNNDDSLSLSKALSLAQSHQHQHAPQASTSNYDSKSNGILKAIQDMQSQAEQELQSVKSKSTKSRHNHELLIQDLTSKIASKTDQLEAAKRHSAEAAGKGKDAGADVENNTVALKDFKKQLRNVKAGCERSAKAWAARSTEAGEEVSVLGKGIDILSGKFGGEESEEKVGGSLLQLRKIRMLKSKGTDNTSTKGIRVSSILRKLRENMNNKASISFNLLQASQMLTATSNSNSSSDRDPFAKVTSLINDMINKLEQEQADEAKKHAQCEINKKKGQAKLKQTKSQMSMLQARSDKSVAQASKLQVEIGEMSDEVKTLEASKGVWTEERNAEAKEYNVLVKDYDESIEALSAAIETLSEFYSGGDDSTSFLQSSTNNNSSKLSDKGNTIISILETSQADFEKLLHQTKSTESESIRSYEQKSQDSDVSLAKTKAMIVGKQSQLASTKQFTEVVSNDLDGAVKAYKAAGEFLKGVMESCAVKVMSFEEKQEKRMGDIKGLKTALEILEGEE